MSNVSHRIASLSVEKRELLARLMKEKGAATRVGRRIPRRPDPEAPAPLSFAQERLWFLEQLEPGNAVYNAPAAMRLRGQLDTDYLERSLTEVVRRHSVLRTTFEFTDGESVQKIAPARPQRIPLNDLSYLPPAEREAELRRLIEENALSPFDLTRGPLLRASLLRLSEEEHVLLCSLHHIIFDGWSLGILIDELTTIYMDYLRGETPALAEPPAQYADFAVWQRERLSGDALEEQLDFWRRQLGDSFPIMQLPFDRARPAVQTYAGARMPLVLPGKLAAALRELSRHEGATLFMTLLAVYKTLLHRYSGQTNLFIGTSIANRPHPDLEGVIGFFANTLVLRTDLSGDPSFRELLGRVRSVALQAYEHQETPFEQLVSALQPERDPSHSPLYQVMFVMQESPRKLSASGMDVELLDPPGGISKFDLTLDVMADSDELKVTLEYNTDLFDHSTAARMLAHFRVLAEAVVADPKRPLSHLPLLTEEERELMLVRWNDTAVAYERDLCAHEIFEARVERRPDSLALSCGDKKLTYEELNRRSNQLARHLRKQGVGPESVIGICVERSPEMAIGILGTLKAGGAYVPLDPTYPAERLRFMLEDSGASVLLTQERLLDLVPDHGARVVCLDADWNEIAAEDEQNPVNLTTPGNLAYMIYTSGSTAKPKGVALAHEGLSNLATAQMLAFGVGEDSRVLQFSSFSFDASVWETIMALLTGGTLCMSERETSLLDGTATLQALREQAITTATLPPSVLAVLSPSELPDLRTLISAGESCSAEIVARWSEGRDFFNAYGPTETTVCASLTKCDPADAQTPSIGRPIANMEIFVLDPHGSPVPVGLPGELYIGGVGLARGYHGRAGLTAEKFVPHPFSRRPGARLYRTGDLVRYLPDGNVVFLGRIDFQVKVRGFRIELEEIEGVLGTLASVGQSVVVAREDKPGERRLVAYVVAREGETPTVEELRGFLKEKLPEYMVPSAFVLLDAFPLTPNGKVNRKALPDPRGSRPNLGAVFVAPQTEVERELAQVWREELGVERVGVNDNFFDLGGHSLLLMKMHHKLQERLRQELPLMMLFKYPTVSTLAHHLSAGVEVRQAEAPAHDRAQKQRAALGRQKEFARRRQQG
jgi:amino acid adenylation domain-containing protein